MPTTELIGATDAARLIGCDKATLTRAVADKRIAYVHKNPGKNGAYVFALDEVERFRTEYAATPSDTGEGEQ